MPIPHKKLWLVLTCAFGFGLVTVAHAASGALTERDAAALQASGKFDQAGAMFLRAADAYRAEGNAAANVKALQESAGAYEKQADSVLRGTANNATPPARAAAPPAVQAQTVVPGAAQASATYKIGDRIDLLAGSVEIGGKYVGGTWQPGTIIGATQAAREMMYLVRYDENKDYWASPSQIRAPTGLITPSAQAQKELAALGALKAPKAGSLDETFQNLIRERYELQGTKDVSVTVVFQGFLIGQTHAYGRPDVYGESSDGPGGTASTTVYPVSAQLTHRHAYRDAFLTYQEDEVYKCFTNAFGKWQCNPDSGGKGTVKQFRVERAEFAAPR